MKKMRKILIVLMAMLPICASAQYAGMPMDTTEMIQLRKLNRALFYVTSGYADTLNIEKVVNAAIIGALGELDPHSAFVSKEEVAREGELFGGNFEGIGIEFNILNDTLMVVNTIAGGPAAQVGLMPSDRIIEVDGVPLIGITNDQVQKTLRGKKGTVAVAKVIRPGVSKPLTFNIIRDKIPIHSLDAAYYIKPNVGYIKLNRFSATTSDEMHEALDKLNEAKAIILDLRGNAGGYYDQSIKVVSNFIEPDKLVVYTQGRTVPRMDEFSKGAPRFGNGTLVVLVDQYSASSSEIVAGALQDWDRATVIGRRTFGKGLVQSQIPLDDGSAIRLTVAHYYTPTGRSIQRPYTMGNKKEYYMDFVGRFNSDEFTNDKPIVDSNLVYHTLLKKRTVYGGGGITPDVIVPIDTTGYSGYWGDLLRNGVFLDYIMDKLDKGRNKLLRSYPDFNAFEKNYALSEKDIEDLIKFGEKKGVKPNMEDLDVSKDRITAYVKALLAGRLYESEDYFRIMNKADDREVEEALKLIENS